MNNNTTRPYVAALAALMFAPALAVAHSPELSVEPSEHGMRVLVDGELFTEYRTNSHSRPVLWPLIGPTGDAMTRSWPVGERLEHEEDDHPHHRGVWFGYDQVNGHNFWLDQPRADGLQVHQGFDAAEADGATAKIVTRNEWRTIDGELVAKDTRSLRFGAEEDLRWVDFQIDWSGADQSLKLGDSKEGLFAIRVPGTMKLDAGMGGGFTSSAGREGAKAWGMPAEWVHYYGPATAGSDKTLAITMMSHPDNFRPTPRWHVRTYGLFAANPLGQHHFPKDGGVTQGPIEVPEGESLTLRYRLLLHEGKADEANVAEKFAQFAASKAE